jgi:hypothetical protein
MARGELAFSRIEQGNVLIDGAECREYAGAEPVCV